jgi:hypothetical protein
MTGSRTLPEFDAAMQAGPRRVLVVLCATEITSWGVLYYAFPVLAGHITAATGWPASAITAALSAGQLVPRWWASRWGGGWIATARVG